jgi:photosystem II stability/assembly factor-like uncharacterized protein
MKGDLSRNTFDRALHYNAVRLQQGRIVTDADWNEQADLTRYRAERQARDTIGACGAPLHTAGYALVAETNALAVHAVNANVTWIAAEDGVVLHTSNGGADWTLIDFGTTANVRALQQVGGVGWAVGDGGIVRKTNNHGLTWVAQNPGTFVALRGLSVFDADHAWAVGDGGVIVATTDGGASWSLAKTGAARLYAVHFIDELAGLAVGQGGAITATRDGGQTWTGVSSGTTAHLRALAGVGTTLAWAAGQNGTIVRSVDAGATWLPCTTPSVATLYAIGFRDQSEGWAVGEGGVVLHTADGGVSWSLENVGTQADLRGVSFFGSDPGWLVGAASTVLRIGGGSPDVAGVALPAVNLSIEPGRCYVNGALCELEARASYAHQPDGGAAERLGPGGYLIYLDAWQRHVSALEAPSIREIALGGPDTATRGRAVAQVRALALPPSSPFDWSCRSTIATWDQLVNAQSPVLTARAEPQLAASSLCEIAATAGFRRLENQLYRVEVHEGGANPTFKWSRENGSVAYAVVSVNTDVPQQQTTVRLAARGRDDNLDLAVHDRVELVDDEAELVHRAGVFFEYLNDGNDELELVLAGLPLGALGQDPARHPILRRWDHRPAVAGENVLPIIEGTWIDLEDGVQVRFGPGGQYRPGDYWQIPARTISADIEWPRNDDGDPLARSPAGIADDYCRLGIVEVAEDGSITVVSDCRELFPPLTAMEQLLYVSGDGQDAPPNALLPQPLAVRVALGKVPVPGRGIRFEIESGGGAVGVGGSQFETVTGIDGLALCDWRLGAGVTAPTRFQRMRASLLDDNGQPLLGQLVVFCATSSDATAAASATAGCDVTIGKGGDFDTLSVELLRKLLEQGRGNACVCFLPGMHELTELAIDGSEKFRLSLHGCGHASQLNLRGSLMLGGFVALELRDIAMRAEDETGMLLRKNGEVRLTNVLFDRSHNTAQTAALSILGAQSVSVTGCEILTQLPTMAALFQDIDGACRVMQNRFVGLVSFYGEGGVLSPDVMRKLASRQNLRLKSGESRLSFCNNDVSQLTVETAMAKKLSTPTGTASGVFASAIVHGNTFTEQNSLFVAGLLGFDTNTFVAPPHGDAMYGVMMAMRATAAANLAVVLADHLVLHFVVPDPGSFAKAANQVTIQP